MPRYRLTLEVTFECDEERAPFKIAGDPEAIDEAVGKAIDTLDDVEAKNGQACVQLERL